MEHHKVLVRTIVRAFYETEHIVVIDLLAIHHALSISDIALVLDPGKHVKNVQRICAKLKEAGLVSTYSRQEMREGALKPITREYFFIDYRRAVDATKYRVHMIDERIKRDAKPTAERKEYECRQCDAQWTMMEVLDNIDPEGKGSGFLCKRCDANLFFCNTEDAVQEQDDRPSLFNRQFTVILNLLQRIDESTVPEVTGEQALNDAIPIPRDEHLNPAIRTTALPDAYVKPTAVQGLQTRPTGIDVSIMSEKESAAAEMTAAAQQRARATQQNALPSWYTHSTVTGESVAGVGAAGAAMPGSATAAAFPGEGDDDASQDANLDAYFAALKAAQDREAEEEEEDEDDDDDEDEFEDVPVGGATAEEGPVAKKAKTEAAPLEDDEDDDDEDEFEDVV